MAAQKYIRDSIVRLRKAKFDADAAKTFQLQQAFPIAEVLREITGLREFPKGYAKMTAIAAPTSREGFAEYVTQVQTAGKAELAFIGYQIDPMGRVSRGRGKLLYSEHAKVATPAEMGYNTQSLIKAFEALSAMTVAGEQVFASLLKLAEHNGARLREAHDAAEKRSIIRGGELMFVIAHDYCGTFYSNLNYYAKYLWRITQHTHDDLSA